MSRRRHARRLGGERFARIPLGVLESVAVRTLSHAAFRVLVLLAATYNGHNNGALGLTATQAADAGIASRATFYAALRELSERQLITMTHPASRVPPRPTMWAITWVSEDDTEHSSSTRTPAHSYRKWVPSVAERTP